MPGERERQAALRRVDHIHADDAGMASSVIDHSGSSGGVSPGPPGPRLVALDPTFGTIESRVQVMRTA